MIKTLPSFSRFTLQLVSLLIALLLWFNFSWREGNAKNQQVKIFPSLPLIHENKPPNMKLISENYRVQLHIYGSQKELDQLTSNDIEVSLNLKEYGSGTYNFPLDKNNVTLPTRFKTLSVGEVLPNSVSLTLREMSAKTLTIFMGVEGEPAKNYEFTDLILRPDKVTIEGPTELVEGLKVLVAAPVDISGATENIVGRVQFDFRNQVPRDTIIREDLSSLLYEAIIVEKTTGKRMPKSYPLEIPAKDGHAAAKFDLQLEISGPISLVKWFEADWVIPKAKLVKTDPAPATGDNPPQQPPQPPPAGGPATYEIGQNLTLPEQARTESPDWLAKTLKLTFKWTPALVEVPEK